MTALRVWAREAKSVAADIEQRRHAMQRGDDGWWSIDVPELSSGADYGFVLDGDDTVLPDPRSGWQPNGIHGRSRFVDHAEFPWTDGAWQPPPLSAGVIYELHIGTFSAGGTFDAAIGHLDHLVELGVTHVELMPVAEFSGGRGWGYDGVDLYAPAHSYGGPEGLKRLVNACHQRRLAVILDVVYNHLGPSGNYLERFGPYFTDRYGTPWGRAVNFDGGDSDEVRRFFIDNALMWMRDYHIDGLRLDAVHAIFDTSAIHFLEQLAAEVAGLRAQVGRHLVLIAESDLNDPRVVQSPEAGGYGIDCQWSDDFHHALHAVLSGERGGYYADFGSLADVAKAMRHAFVYDGVYSKFRRRRHGRRPGGLSGSRFTVCLQNHDQIGNRACGERSSHLLSTKQLEIAAALVLASPFVPMLFEGEEWGASTPFQYFTDHQDPELAAAVTAGRRREFAAFGWNPDDVPDPQSPETFERSKLNWDEIGKAPHAHLLDWHRKLIRLRRSLAQLTDGHLETLETDYDDERKWMVIRRGSLAITCNFADRPQRLPLAATELALLLSSDAGAKLADGGIELAGESVAILGSPADAARANLKA